MISVILYIDVYIILYTWITNLYLQLCVPNLYNQLPTEYRIGVSNVVGLNEALDVQILLPPWLVSPLQSFQTKTVAWSYI